MRALLTLLAVCAIACDPSGATQDLAPGSPCGSFQQQNGQQVGVGGAPDIRACATTLPDCRLCVDLAQPDAGHPAACALPCLLDGGACPSGQVCGRTGSGSFSVAGCAGQVPNLGYCGAL